MTTYEWCYETLDEHGDIIESDFEDVLKAFTPNRVTPTLALIRNEGNSIDGLTNRYYAYVVDGKLPEKFEESDISVPNKFHNQINKLNTSRDEAQ